VAPLPAYICHELVTKYFLDQNTDEISSFRFIEIFVNVFADQIMKLFSSQYFQAENLELMVDGKNLPHGQICNEEKSNNLSAWFSPCMFS